MKVSVQTSYAFPIGHLSTIPLVSVWGEKKIFHCNVFKLSRHVKLGEKPNFSRYIFMTRLKSRI